MTVHFDTLAYTKKLTASSMDIAQAEAQAEALTDLLEQNYMPAKDIQHLVEHWSKDLKQAMTNFRVEVREEIHDIKTDVAHLKQISPM